MVTDRLPIANRGSAARAAGGGGSAPCARRIRHWPLATGLLVILTAALGWAADAELARLVEAAKKEGEVHYLDSSIQPKTHAALARTFRRMYGLPESFKVTNTLRGTGEAVATVQQEIKAGQHTIDLMWAGGASSFFKAAAKEGHFLPHPSPEWLHYEGAVRRLGMEADPPHWFTPAAFAFVPVWNRKCPGFANLQIRSWRDALNPAFRGKMILGDVRKSFTYAATWIGMESTLGKDYFPKLVEATQPAIFFRTEEILQKKISCEYPIALWQLPGRVYQRAQEDPTLDLALAWPQEGVVLLGRHMAILKGSRRPHAAKLLMDFLLGEEGMREFVAGEGTFSLREGFQMPPAVQAYLPELGKVKSMPVHWAGLTLAEVRRIQNEFRKVLGVD